MSDAIIPEREVEEQELYHAKSWWTEKVFSQDAKIIAIQYFCTATAIALIGLVLSWFMRMQIAFPGISIISEGQYYQAITMHDLVSKKYCNLPNEQMHLNQQVFQLKLLFELSYVVNR